MEEKFTTQQTENKRPKLPPGSILYSIRLILVILATPMILIEPHTHQGQGYPVADALLMLIPFAISVVLIFFLFKPKRYFFYGVCILAGYNLVLFVLTFTPFFLEEGMIMPFLAAIDCSMVIYLRLSKKAAMFYRCPEDLGASGEAI